MIRNHPFKLFIIGIMIVMALTYTLPQNAVCNANLYAHFGARIGYAFSSFIGQVPGTKDNLSFFKSGFVNAGIFFNLSHVEYIRFQLEMDYHRKQIQSSELFLSAHAVSFPFFVRTQFPFGLIAGLGFAPTYLIEDQFNYPGNPESTFKKELKEIAFDLIAQTGWAWNINNIVQMLFEIRFLYTINNIATSSQKEWHPFVLSASIGFEY